MRPPLTEEEFRLFSEWLAEEYGLCFPQQKHDLLRTRLEPQRAARGFDTFEQLYFHLKFHPERQAERQQLLPYLTNNESYFFRERRQLEVLRDEILPALRDRLHRTPRREVRILSAGCAAGEEPYTLAMVARETKLFRPPCRVRVTGIDLDPRALDRARAGRYTDHAFRGVDQAVRGRYFCPEDDSWRIIASLRDAVEFHQANLVDPAWARKLPPQDVIFCRNVLIYFDDDGMTRAVQALYDALAPRGYLFLGHAESLSRTPTRLRPVRRPGAVFYCRPDEGTGKR